MNGYLFVFGASQVVLLVKNPPANAGNVRDSGSIPGLGRLPGGGHGNPLQYSCLENPHGQRSLASYSPWGRRELDTTARTQHARTHTDHLESAPVKAFRWVRNSESSCRNAGWRNWLYFAQGIGDFLKRTAALKYERVVMWRRKQTCPCYSRKCSRRMRGIFRVDSGWKC